MQSKMVNKTGKELKSVDLPESVFNLPMNEHVLYSVVKAHRANRRQGTHATKTRSFVRGGGKKPFKQKGTGNARQGSSRSPLFPGGATVHGPVPRDYSEKTNRKLKMLALKVALSDKVRHGKLLIINDFSIDAYRTKDMVTFIKGLGLHSVLVAHDGSNKFLYRATRNIKGAESKSSREINAEDVLRYETLLVSEKGLEALKERMGV